MCVCVCVCVVCVCVCVIISKARLARALASITVTSTVGTPGTAELIAVLRSIKTGWAACKLTQENSAACSVK